MAISNSDGSISLTTTVDTSGIEKGLVVSKEKIKAFAKSTSSAFEKLFSSLNGVVGKLIVLNFLRRFVSFSGEASKAAIQTESSVNRLIDIYGDAADAVGDFIDENSKGIGLSKSAAAQFASIYGNLFSAFADQVTNAELTNKYLRMTAVVATKTGRTMEDVQERVRSGLLGNTEAIEDLGIFVNVKTIEMTDAFKRMANGKSWEQLDTYTQQQIRSIAILEQATKKYGNEVEETTSLIKAEYNAAWEDFSATWGQLVNKVLIPILSVLTDILDITTTGLQTIFGLSDKILGNTDDQKDKIAASTDNQKDLTDEVNKTADATERVLAGFDDLQILSVPKTEENVGGGGGAPPNIIDGLKDVNGDSSKIEQESNRFAEAMMGIVGGALAGIGIILLTKGKIGWGLGFITSGAFAFGVRAISGIKDASDQGAGAVVLELMQIIEEALPAVGLMLLMKGQIAWGISFMVAGAALMAIEYFATTEFSTDPIQNTLQKVLGIVGTSLLAIGIILVCFGVLPLGIAMIVAGGFSIVSSIALNSDYIVESIKGPIGAIMGVVSASLLVLGLILLFTGAGIPLGLGLIAVGAAGLAAPISLNWNWIIEKISEVGNAIGKIFSNLWNGIQNGFKNMVNGIITFANFWIDGLNLLLLPIRGIITGVSNAFGQNVSLGDIKIPHIPKLAKGAVLPANKPFIAMLGDQRSGTNVEAPLHTIEEAVENVLKRTNYTTKEEHYYLSERELMSIIYKLAKNGERINGSSFVSDGGF